MVNSWFAYDIDFITKSMERAQRMGLFAFLRYEKARKRYEQLLSGLLWLGRKISFGTDRYVVMVDAKGKYNGQKLIEMRMIEGNCNIMCSDYVFNEFASYIISVRGSYRGTE